MTSLERLPLGQAARVTGTAYDGVVGMVMAHERVELRKGSEDRVRIHAIEPKPLEGTQFLFPVENLIPVVRAWVPVEEYELGGRPSWLSETWTRP